MDRGEVGRLIREGIDQSEMGVLVRQLGGAVARGVATVAWPGAATISNFSAVITHGLQGTPRGVLLTAQGQGGTGPVFAWAEAVGGSTFTFRASTLGFMPAAGVQQTFAWEAFL